MRTPSGKSVYKIALKRSIVECLFSTTNTFQKIWKSCAGDLGGCILSKFKESIIINLFLILLQLFPNFEKKSTLKRIKKTTRKKQQLNFVENKVYYHSDFLAHSSPCIIILVCSCQSVKKKKTFYLGSKINFKICCMKLIVTYIGNNLALIYLIDIHSIQYYVYTMYVLVV